MPRSRKAAIVTCRRRAIPSSLGGLGGICDPSPEKNSSLKKFAASVRLWAPGVGLGGTNLCDMGLNLSGSWQQGHSATYNTPSRI